MDTESTLSKADLAMVLRCQLGDELAFERLVAQYSDRLRFYVRRLIVHKQNEDDIMQQTWLAVWMQLPKLRRPEAFRTWLYRIARNQTIQDGRRPISVALDEDFPVPDDDESVPFRADEAAAVHTELATLTAPHREVLTLRFLEQMTYAEIANIVGCSLGTVRSRVHYAKKELRKRMEKNSHE